MHPLLWSTLAICFGIQAVFFAFAASLKTDKVTDLSYGLTFIAAAVWLWLTHGDGAAPGLVLTAMVVLWGVRLSAYLFRRILHMQRDARFDGVREHFWRFAKFWFFQGLAVWLILLPVTLWFETPLATWSPSTWIGALIWAAGLLIEAVADQQKFAHRRTAGARWTDIGLWKYSRHPNYFGELLCWWGVFVFTAADLAGMNAWLAAIGPLSITGVLLCLTGIPPLEESADRKWGKDPAYQAYKRRTNLLVLGPRRA
jgi:steroid 5-alpha reductase family enzyme